MHIGSQLRSLEPYRRAVAALARVGDFGVYDLGGGLGVPYLAGEQVPDPEEWVRTVVAAAHARARGPASRSCSSRAARWSPTRA